MEIRFTKYQGTGNDFIMLDNMDGAYDELNVVQISFLCDRRMGIGADGLIKISKSTDADFFVDYFNADGSQSFCGNGGRCSAAFAAEIGLIDNVAIFQAIDGNHKAMLEDGIVRLEMLPVDEIISVERDYFVDTGSPHYVHLKADNDPDITVYGKQIRYSKKYVNQGVNVNYLKSLINSEIEVETYERGVEDETLSCGTGVTACALVQMNSHPEITEVSVKTKGGVLKVEASRNRTGGYDNIWLSGPAKRVYEGSLFI